MHGCGSGSALLVNAEVDSMGGVVDGGVGIGIKTSPRRAAIEKAQSELRQEYDVREERRRELEFLEKGGNPLDFKFGNAASVSVQSTSLTDHQAEHFVTSEAKGSFALTASPHGDSVESSGRLGVPTICEPNSADNFDGGNELLEGERKVKHPTRRNKIVPSEQSSEMDGAQNAKESEDSAIFHSYARRNRSRPNRDAARSSSTDVVQSSVGHGSSLPVKGGSRDVKGSVSETKNHKENTIPSASIPKSTLNGDVPPQIESSTTQSTMELDGLQAPEATEILPKDSLPEERLGVTEGNNLMDSQPDQSLGGDSQKICKDIGSEVCDHAAGKEQVISTGPEVAPNSDTMEFEKKTSSVQLNGFSDSKGDENEGQNDIATTRTKALDPASSCTQNILSLDANNDTKLCVTQINEATDGILTEQAPECEERNIMVCNEKEHKKDDTIASESCTVVNDDRNLVDQNPSSNGSVLKTDEVKCPPNIEETVKNKNVAPEADKIVGNSLDGNSCLNGENICPGGPQASLDKSVQELPVSILSEKNSALSDPQLCSSSPLKLAEKAREDSILEEARIIEAKRKRIAELSVGTIQPESRRKNHWDFVLEEMTWLANDFAQERLWKVTAAAQICRRVALTNRLRVEEQNQLRKLKRVAYTLTKAVMQFWNSAEVLLNSEDQSSSMKNCNHDSRRLDCNEFSKDNFGELDKETCDKVESQNPGKSFGCALQGYAVRFLKFNSSPVPSVQAEAPATPDRITDLGIMDVSWDDNLTEESLFYAVPSGAMETYRTSIESHLAQCEKTGSSMQEEVDTSMYDAAAEIGYHENIYDEEEGETSMYYLPGFDGSKSTKHDQKKRKDFTRSYSARSYEADMPYGHLATVSQQHALMGKRSAHNVQVGSIPTKRMRTAAVVRQRVISPFGGAGVTVPLPAQTKTDASSGDTSSFQDDQSTLHGGFLIQKSMEVESVADFERQLPYECAETSTKPKKKKKAKHLGSAYEPAWQLDSIVNNEQRESSRKRVEGHHFDSNGTSGFYGQHAAKKPKIKQSLDNSFDNVSGSIPSPAASQMSNMSNTNRFMKIINGREKGRKNKSLKVSAVQPGSGSPWSLFEDQALVVLVHDMGPNWELVSDAINSTLQFKCIFRKSLECRERHKVLMDKGAGDGADSADDSGSSQSYPSTLPGIPKGSARQLFQRLQGPMLEETLKSHFEKIIMIGKKQLYRRNQNDNQDTKQLAAVHNSHVISLSQVCPNNLNGGLLTPLDLCDASASSPDVLPLGYQGSHASGLPLPNQGAVASMLPTSANSPLQGSSGMVLGNNSTSPSGPLTAPVRDGRYSVPRASLPVDEQQRMQHYNQMLSGRNMQQSNLSVSSALTGSDRRMLPGGSGMGMMPGVNRNMPLSRPAYQGMASSPMLNSGTMLSSSMVGMPSPANMHSGTGSAQGNSMMRPREALHMMRPGHNPEHQRQMTVPEIQMQVSQGNSPGIPGFNGMSSAFANQTTPPPVQGYPGHPQQHQMSAQQSHVLNNPHHHLQGPNKVTVPQQAYAMHLAKERQMQQRILHQQQQQQQQLAASSALMPHVQPQSQLPTSSSVQTSTQVQPPSSQPSSMPPLAPSSPLTPISMQQQQKHNLPHHGLNRNPQASAIGLNNQIGKQRQRQPQQQQQQFQQTGRHHPQQRQHSQSPQQAKLMKGIGRGNMVAHQSLPMDPSHLNGLSVSSGNQGIEKGEQIMHLVQGQGLYPGTGLSPMQPSKPLVPQSSNHSQQQPKMFSGSTPPSSKQLQQLPSHSDNSAQGQVHPVSSGHGIVSSHQAVPSSTMVPNHQHMQAQPHQKQVSQSQPIVQRIPQLNRQVSSDLPAKSQNDHGLTDQQPVNSVPQMTSSTTAAMPQTCSDSANAVPVNSSAVASQWKQSESLYDSGLSNPVLQAGSTGSPCLTNSAGSESVLSASQGLGPRQLSGGLAQHGHNPGSQWQQQPQIQQPKIPPQTSQQQFQPQEQQQEQDRQLPLQQQSQQQAHLQTAQGSAYVRPTNSKMD